MVRVYMTMAILKFIFKGYDTLLPYQKIDIYSKADLIDNENIWACTFLMEILFLFQSLLIWIKKVIITLNIVLLKFIPFVLLLICVFVTFNVC